jgi:hypothetical protein
VKTGSFYYTFTVITGIIKSHTSLELFTAILPSTTRPGPKDNTCHKASDPSVSDSLITHEICESIVMMIMEKEEAT